MNKEVILTCVMIYFFNELYLISVSLKHIGKKITKFLKKELNNG